MLDNVTVVPLKKPDDGLTEAQRIAVEDCLEKQAALARVPTVTFKEIDGGVTVEFEGVNQLTGFRLLGQAIGIYDHELLMSFLSHCALAVNYKAGKPAQSFNALIQTTITMKPADLTEALMCAQMTAIHNAMMFYSGRFYTAEDKAAESYEKGMNRLARTYAAQMQSLKIYRAKGKQNITVKHVTVNDGGQAIVGNVATGGRGGRRAENDG